MLKHIRLNYNIVLYKMDNMEKLDELLFSPLTKNHCVYFYILMIGALVTMVVNILGLIWISTKNKASASVILRHAAFTLIPGLIGYYHTRLFYTMCKN